MKSLLQLSVLLSLGVVVVDSKQDQAVDSQQDQAGEPKTPAYTSVGQPGEP